MQTVNMDQTMAFLGHLPFNSTHSSMHIQQQIQKAFADCELADIRVKSKKDKSNNLTIYAFVRFKSPAEALKAIQFGTVVMNETEVKVQRFSPQKDYQIYIKETFDLTAAELTKYFSNYGKIEDIHIYSPQDRFSCLVRFENKNDAERILTSPEHIIKNYKIRLEKYVTKLERREQHNKLFLKKIPMVGEKPYLEYQLNKEFKRFGDLFKEIEIIPYKQKKNSDEPLHFGCAIIFYKNQRSAEIAKQNFNLQFFGKQNPMQIDVYLSKEERLQRHSIFVSNLLTSVTREQLLEVFSQFGKIETVMLQKVKQNKQGEKILSAVITYSNKEALVEALVSARNQKRIIALFVKKHVKINIYQDVAERNEFRKAVNRPFSRSPEGYSPNRYSPQRYSPQSSPPIKVVYSPPKHFLIGNKLLPEYKYRENPSTPVLPPNQNPYMNMTQPNFPPNIIPNYNTRPPQNYNTGMNFNPIMNGFGNIKIGRIPLPASIKVPPSVKVYPRVPPSNRINATSTRIINNTSTTINDTSARINEPPIRIKDTSPRIKGTSGVSKISPNFSRVPPHLLNPVTQTISPPKNSN